MIPESLLQVVDMLAETRTELDDFHQASKELEAELESELQRTEKAQQELQAKVSRATNERDEWKVRVFSEIHALPTPLSHSFVRTSLCPFKQCTILPRPLSNAS